MPKAADRGLACRLASLCGALPIPEVMGLFGTPGLCTFGNPRILGGLGASSSSPSIYGATGILIKEKKLGINIF